MMIQPKPPRVIFDAATGWRILTTFALSQAQVAACVAHARAVQGKRARQLSPGDHRDHIIRALAVLDAGTIQQEILPASAWERERNIFIEQGV